MQEKRRFRRVPFAASVTFSLEDGSQIVNECLNISMIGVFTKCGHPLPVNTPGKLTLALECGEEKLMVCAEARVARIVPAEAPEQDAGMGLEFIDLDPDSSITLYNIIRYQTAE